MDPRVKIVLLFFFLLLIFFVENAAGFLALSVSVALLMVFSEVPLGMQLRSIRPILWIVLFTFGVHLFMTPGTELFRAGPFAASWEGLARGAYIALRLVLLILLSTLLTLTTSPLRLTDGLEALLDRIMKAQKARGADFERGNMMQRLRAVVPILVPLFLSAFRRADELALAMEARCYRGGEGRTQMKELRTGRLDYAAIAVFVAGAAGICAVSLGGLPIAP